MTNTRPDKEQLEIHLGGFVMQVWNELIGFVESSYNFEPVWNDGGKYGTWELKYRRSGKTLCTFYVKDGYFTVLVVLGKAEREKFDSLKEGFSSKTCDIYSNTPQYHDGKWLWIDVSDMSLVEDIKRLIEIKKKPVRKESD